jgi:8-oxo-dGTP pyrophosphatase MutT (NUDIX family)
MDNVINFIEYFRKYYQENQLPGKSVQIAMAPRIDNIPIRGLESSRKARKSSVLILLSFDDMNSDYRVVFTLRNSNLSHHGGQISFPGGRNENEETAEQAAQREAEEEIGLSSRIEFLGRLTTLYVPPSNNEITPVVAYLPESQEWIMQEEEVEEVFELNLNDFIDRYGKKEEYWTMQGENVLVPFWDVHPKTKLWGATAMIFYELLDIYKIYLDNK